MKVMMTIWTSEGRNTHPLLPGRHQGDAEVQQRGAAAAAEGDEPSRHPNADGKEEGGVRINITSHITAHATLPSSEELLHRRVRSLPLPGHQETRQPHLCQRRAAGTEMSSSSVLRLSFLGGTYTEVKLKLFFPSLSFWSSFFYSFVFCIFFLLDPMT